MKYVLWVYALVLVVLLVSSMVREGFESSPQSIKSMANEKVLLAVTMDKCVHCENMKPAWQAAAAKQPGKMVAIEQSDTSPEAKTILDELNVQSFPSIFVMDHGKMVKTYEGGRTEQDFLAEVASM